MTNSGLVVTETVSLREKSSLQIFEYSFELMVTTDWYSVSGIAKCSLSMVIKLRLNSVVLSFFEFSKTILR